MTDTTAAPNGAEAPEVTAAYEAAKARAAGTAAASGHYPATVCLAFPAAEKGSAFLTGPSDFPFGSSRHFALAEIALVAGLHRVLADRTANLHWRSGHHLSLSTGNCLLVPFAPFAAISRLFHLALAFAA